MKDPVRLADQARGSLAVELLHLARAERPPAGDLARLGAALGLGTTAVAVSATSSGTSVAASALAGAGTGGSAIRIGLANASAAGSEAATGVPVAPGVGGVVELAAHATRPLMGALGRVAIRRLLVRAVCVGVGVGTAARWKSRRRIGPTLTASIPAGQTPISGTTTSQEPSRGPEIGTVTNAHPSAVVGVPPAGNVRALASLAPELDLLDRARSLLDSGRLDAALSLLDSYDSRFPAGTLAPEARVIRIQTLLRSGKRAHAVELGSAFLASDPSSPHAHRIRQLLTTEAGPVRPKRAE